MKPTCNRRLAVGFKTQSQAAYADRWAAIRPEGIMFGFDSEGRITFNGTPYLYSSCGSTSEGLRRAEQKAAWLNRCLASALAAAQQAGVTDVARSQTIEVNPD